MKKKLLPHLAAGILLAVFMALGTGCMAPAPIHGAPAARPAAPGGQGGAVAQAAPAVNSPPAVAQVPPSPPAAQCQRRYVYGGFQCYVYP